MTHSELNDIARRWLLRPESARGPGCKIALNEVGAVGDTELADAWGYRWGWQGGSVLVESKVSRSDFLRDKHKPHRRQEPGVGLGDFRYYICPEGLINIDDLPDRWGLLWVNKRGHVKPIAGHICCLLGNSFGGNRDLANLWRHQPNIDAERGLLSYMLHRVGDPDALLQEQRGYLRLNTKLEKRIAELEAEGTVSRLRIGKLRRSLRNAGLPDPEMREPLSILEEAFTDAIS